MTRVEEIYKEQTGKDSYHEVSCGIWHTSDELTQEYIDWLGDFVLKYFEPKGD